MVTFNNVIDKAIESICQWEANELLSEVTVILDVYGKLAFLITHAQSMSNTVKQQFHDIMNQRINTFFSGRIYWKNTATHNPREDQRIQLIVDIINTEHVFIQTQDGINFYLAERPIAKKAWVKNYAPQTSVWPYEEAIQNHGTKVVTFYSFKGGMGRTTALAAVAINLIRQGKNVIMIDTDIEAPGLATLFLHEDLIQNGVLDYLIEHEIIPSRSIQDYVLDITDSALIDEYDGNLYLMPAGKVDEHYLQKLARIDYQDNRENHLKDIMTAMLVDIREHYSVDYILIDARAGFHDMGGVSVAQLPHASVLFGNQSRQSWDGIKQVLSTIAQGHDEDYPVMLVDSMCEKVTSANFSEVKATFTQKAFEVCEDCYYDTSNTIPGIDADGVAHSPEFISFNDALLQGIELYSNGSPEQNARVQAYRACLTNESYQKITTRIQGWFGEEGNEH